jgi:hypothetical protein
MARKRALFGMAMAALLAFAADSSRRIRSNACAVAGESSTQPQPTRSTKASTAQRLRELAVNNVADLFSDLGGVRAGDDRRADRWQKASSMGRLCPRL